MKGKIVIKWKGKNVLRGDIDIPLAKPGKLVWLEGKGGKIRVYVRAENPNHLICFMVENLIMFEFNIKGKRWFKATGENLGGEGINVSWTCSFKKTGD